MATQPTRTSKRPGRQARNARSRPPHPPPLEVTGVTEWQEGKIAKFEDYLVGEEPLEIRIERFRR